MTAPTSLILRFRGWGIVRIATEPDPPDERWGASGYTFAFAGEPPLDRVIRLQPLDESGTIRPGAPPERFWGVYVHDAFVLDTQGGRTAMPDLRGARVNLRGNPKFENRSWLFTPPGFEPIVPFDLAIEPRQGATVLSRSAPLDPGNSNKPVWQQPKTLILRQGAKDIVMERETLGSATGLWDALPLFRQRIATLDSLLKQEKDDTERQCLQSRLSELEFAVHHPRDRRVMVSYMVERFGVSMLGADAVVPPDGLLATLDVQTPWFADFWIGAWDFDLLGAFFNGSLQIPFKPPKV